KEIPVSFRRGPAIDVLIGNRNQTFVEQWITLPSNLDHVAFCFVRAIIPKHPSARAAGGSVHADHLHIATNIAYRDRKRHQMKVETALRIFARVSKFQ